MTFVSIIGNKIIFSPDQTKIGSYTITLSCTDNQNIKVDAVLNFLVANGPKFKGSVIQNINLIASNPASYTLPIFPGIVGENVNHTASLPPFVTFKSPLYEFLPNTVNDLGIKSI